MSTYMFLRLQLQKVMCGLERRIGYDGDESWKVLEPASGRARYLFEQGWTVSGILQHLQNHDHFIDDVRNGDTVREIDLPFWLMHTRNGNQLATRGDRARVIDIISAQDGKVLIEDPNNGNYRTVPLPEYMFETI